MHRTEQAQLIGNGSGVWQQIGNGDARLATRSYGDVRAKGQQAFRALVTMLLGQGCVHRLSVPLLNQRLRVEKIHLRRAACHEEKDDAFCLGAEQRRAYGEWVCCRLQKTVKSYRAEACAGVAQPCATRGGIGDVIHGGTKSE
jgi:hypothetical protein